MAGLRTALCTAVYPGVEPWLPELCRSIMEQSDHDFELLVVLDGVSETTWLESGGRDLRARLIPAPPGATPAEVRNVLLYAACAHDLLVLVDSDDVLLPERTAAARRTLQSADVAGCAMELVDVAGRPLGHTFGSQYDVVDDALILETNLFGMGNSAWHSRAMLPCLPIPPACKAADWFLATRARLQGRTFRFDPVPRMRYRQHPNNLAGVVPPFSPERLLRGADLAREHFDLVLGLREAEPGTRYRERLLAASRGAARFCQRARTDSEWLAGVASDRNRRGPLEAWWAFLSAQEEDE